MIVVDASVLTDFLLGRAEAMEVVARELGDEPHQLLHAPELVDLETLNALRRMARQKVISRRRALEAAADLDGVRLARYSHRPLRERVWALRDRLTAYDASYLALAEGLDAPVLLTADSGLATVARRSLGAGGVRQVR